MKVQKQYGNLYNVTYSTWVKDNVSVDKMSTCHNQINLN